MNYYQARQRAKDGKWHFTCRNGKHIIPVGFCAEDCPGHDTPEGANEHYRQHLLSNAVFKETFIVEVPCKVCQTLTKHGAILQMSTIPLCGDHNDLETLEKVYGPPSQIWTC